MILLKRAITYAAILGIGAFVGYKIAHSNIALENFIIPRSSYCLQIEQPLKEYFQENFSLDTKPMEIYTNLELMVKQCGK